MPNACAGITACRFQHSPAHSLVHSRSHFWFVSCHLKHKQRRGAHGEKRGGGGMGWREDEARFPVRHSSSFCCPQEQERSSCTASCVDPLHISPSVTEKCFWKTASLGCSWVFFPTSYICFVFYCSSNIRRSQNKMTLQHHMEKRPWANSESRP